VLIEALIDFPEEELDFLARYPIREPLELIYQECSAFVKKVHAGAWLQKGVNIVLLGAPNVGKSSLLNGLADEDVAIVTAIAGTTRDPIRHALNIRGIPVRLVDTAGVRSTTDHVEQLGIERTWKEARTADIVVLMQSCEDEKTAEIVLACDREISANTPRVWVHNKVDVIGCEPFVEVDDFGRSHVYISAKTRLGLDLFEALILQLLHVEMGNAGETVFIARQRHLEALNEAMVSFEEARQIWDVHTEYGEVIPLELLAETLRVSQLSLSRITGEFTADDLLGKIFGEFCIGK
jgi:tRNA modification GTPase